MFLLAVMLCSGLFCSVAQAQLSLPFMGRKNTNEEGRQRPVVAVEAGQSEVVVQMQELVAEVNAEKIMNGELTEECLLIHGRTELLEQVKKFLIQQECRQRGITVTSKEINDEIARMAKTFKFSTEEWLNLLEQERGIESDQYREDIIRPLLSINKLAGSQLQVSEAELQKEFNTQFGPAVQVRQIVLKSQSDAQRVLTEVKTHPDSFAAVAKNHSMDAATQPYGGLLHPIRHGTLDNAEIEKILFGLKPGDISPIIEYPAGMFIIFRCEQHLQPQQVDMVRVRERLEMKIRDVKTREVAAKIFTDLQNKAKIDIVYGDPAKMRQQPGIAAIVNGETLSMKFLGDLCVKRYGKTILNDMIGKRIVEQACRKENIVVTDADINNEIREMAIKHVKLKADGSPDIDGWIRMATDDGRIPFDIYRRNTVWPVLALKRLTREMVKVTPEDIQRSFEANYGRKVNCLAIALNDQRRALEVWQLANRHKTPESFGDLAEKYSVDVESRVSRGVIPPVAKFCGQKELEDEAFGLTPNEISQIIQIDGNWIILYCLGFEEPSVTNVDDVKVDLMADIFDKKQKLVIEKYYDILYNQAAFDNYLTGESRNPQIEKDIRSQNNPVQATMPGSGVR